MCFFYFILHCIAGQTQEMYSLVILYLVTLPQWAGSYFSPHKSVREVFVKSMQVDDKDSLSEVFPFRNISLPWDARVDDLVKRLSLEEIQLQMARGGAGKYGGPAPAIPRLGNFFYHVSSFLLY